MIASTVWNQLVLTLQNDPTLSEYIENVFKGRRYDIVPESLPCIQLEPVRDGEIEKDMNQVQDVYLTVNVFAFTSNNLNNFETSIVGDQNYRGILDINNDIRACLQSSYTLSDNVIDVRFDPTEFDTIETEQYPVRGMVMPIKILYRQFNGV